MTSWSTYYQSAFEAVVNRNRQKHLGGIWISLVDAEPLICDPFVLCKYGALNLAIQAQNSGLKNSRDISSPQLDLSDHKEATVIEMLRFVYLGETEDLTTKISLSEDLVKLGNELQFTELLSCCSAWLESDAIEVTRDSVGRLFDVALLSNCKKMMKRCILRYLLEEELLKLKVKQWIFEERVDVFAAFFEFSCGFKVAVQNDDGQMLQILQMLQLSGQIYNKTNLMTLSDDLFHKITQGENVLYPDMLVKVSYTTKEVSYHCHRSILSNSKVLKAIIDGNLNETSEKVITITDVPAEAMVEVLRYLYTAKTGDLMQQFQEQTLGSVFMAELVIRKAHEYDLPELVDNCIATLMQAELTTDNVFRLLGIGRLYSLPDLQNRCLQFIHQHRTDVTKHPSFKAFVTHDVESVRLAVLAAIDYFRSNRSRTVNLKTRIMVQKMIDMKDNEEITVHTEEVMGIVFKIWFRMSNPCFRSGHGFRVYKPDSYPEIKIGIVVDYSLYTNDALKVAESKIYLQRSPGSGTDHFDVCNIYSGCIVVGKELNLRSVQSDKPKQLCFEYPSGLRLKRYSRSRPVNGDCELTTELNLEL